jgi:hypothetical protein
VNARIAAGAQLCEPDAANDSVISIGPVDWEQSIWHAGPDLAHAAMKGGRREIIRAWRLRSEGGQRCTLTPLLFRKTDLIDPRADDFFAKLIELRMRETDDALDDKRAQGRLQGAALSGAYGTAAEKNPIDIEPDDEKRKQRAETKITRLAPRESRITRVGSSSSAARFRRGSTPLFDLDEHCAPHMRKYYSLVLGQIRLPLAVPRDSDPRAWIWRSRRARFARHSESLFLRSGKAPTACTEFKVYAAPSVRLAAAYLANAINWNGGSTIAAITPVLNA